MATRRRSSSRESRKPPRGTTEPRCTGLVIEVGDAASRPADRLRLAEIVVGRSLGSGYALRPLGQDTRDVVVTRKRGSIGIGEAWDLAARLASDRDVASAEPAFRMAGLEPDPQELERWLTPDEIAAATPRSAQGARRGDAKDAEALTCSIGPAWSLDACKVPAALTLPLPGHGHGKRMGEGIVVGHPDTGYTDHPAVQGPRLLVARGFDFVDSNADARDELAGGFPGHGTGTASVIMGEPSAAPGGIASGVATRAQLVPMRVSTSVVHFDFENVASAIHLAVESGCHVISMSLGGPFGPRFLRRAIRRAVDDGIVVLAAAGNVWPFVVFPARYDEVVAVAAVNCARKPWKGSAKGSDVDLSAPGESTWRAIVADPAPPKFAFARGNGTSFAVAHAAGACALWLAHHGREQLLAAYGKPGLVAVFKELLVATAVAPPQWKKRSYGSGILDVQRLVAAPLPATAPAGGFRSVSLGARTRSRSAMAEFLPYFPGEDEDSLRRGLAAALGIPARRSAMELTDNREEILFHVATDPTFRQAVRDAGQPARAAAPARRAARAAAPALPRHASERLRRAAGTR